MACYFLDDVFPRLLIFNRHEINDVPNANDVVKYRYNSEYQGQIFPENAYIC